MKSKAVLIRESGLNLPYAKSKPLEIVDIDLAPPKAGEVLVKIESAGICHSDLSVVNGSRVRPLPIIIGHESSGVVLELGHGVQDFKVGDHFTTVFLPSCQNCYECKSGIPANCSVGAKANANGQMIGGGSRISIDGNSVNHYNGVSCYSQYAVIDQRSLVKLPSDIPFDIAALFGCALLTGIGAVRNSAQAKEGQSLGIWGLGGVGLSALLGAVISKASPIIVIDPVGSKRELALSLGADIALDPKDDLRNHLQTGVSVAIEAAGRADTLMAAYEATARGGTTVSVGLPKAEEKFSISALSLVADVKTIKGSYLGSANPRLDIPEFVDFWRDGKLPVGKLLTSTSSMSQVNEAMDALEGAQVVRQVIHPHK